MSNSGASQPAGWYYAAGDPPGTQRYWDGVQWQGAPQPIDGGGGTGSGNAVGDSAPAEMGPRFIAALIDGGIMIGLLIVVLILGAIGGAIADALGALIIVLGYLAVFGFALYNAIYLQGTTGQTIGKKHQDIKVVADATGQPIGVGAAVARYLVGGFIASICWIDLIWILVDENNRRISDNLLNFQVLKA